MNIIKSKKRGILMVLSGPSGSGKDTVCNKLVENNPNIWISVSCTSRSPRKGEVDGENYFFLTREEFEDKIEAGDLLEYAEYNGNYYGTPRDKVNEYLDKGIDVILVIEVQGAKKIKELVPDALFVFILPPSMGELKRRLITRGTESEEKILSRFRTAYQEINELSKYNYVVINDDIDDAVRKVDSILISEKCRVDRIEEVYVSNTEEEMHELLMDKEFDNSVSEI